MHRQLDNFPEALHSVEDAQLSRRGAIVDPVHKVLTLGRHLAKEHKEGDEVAVEGHEFPEAEREGLQAPEVAVDVLAEEAFADEDQPVLGQLPKVLQNARKGNHVLRILKNCEARCFFQNVRRSIAQIDASEALQDTQLFWQK